MVDNKVKPESYGEVYLPIAPQVDRVILQEFIFYYPSSNSVSVCRVFVSNTGDIGRHWAISIFYNKKIPYVSCLFLFVFQFEITFFLDLNFFNPPAPSALWNPCTRPNLISYGNVTDAIGSETDAAITQPKYRQRNSSWLEFSILGDVRNRAP
jgi:hypothetical protein